MKYDSSSSQPHDVGIWGRHDPFSFFLCSFFPSSFSSWNNLKHRHPPNACGVDGKGAAPALLSSLPCPFLIFPRPFLPQHPCRSSVAAACDWLGKEGRGCASFKPRFPQHIAKSHLDIFRRLSLLLSSFFPRCPAHTRPWVTVHLASLPDPGWRSTLLKITVPSISNIHSEGPSKNSLFFCKTASFSLSHSLWQRRTQWPPRRPPDHRWIVWTAGPSGQLDEYGSSCCRQLPPLGPSSFSGPVCRWARICRLSALSEQPHTSFPPSRLRPFQRRRCRRRRRDGKMEMRKGKWEMGNGRMSPLQGI